MALPPLLHLGSVFVETTVVRTLKLLSRRPGPLVLERVECDAISVTVQQSWQDDDGVLYMDLACQVKEPGFVATDIVLQFADKAGPVRIPTVAMVSEHNE